MRSRNDHDVVTMAVNDLGPSDVHIPSAMPNFASGYRNEPPIADLMVPPILAPKQVDDFFQFAKEDAFQRAAPMATAGGAEVPEISPRLSNDQYSAKGRGIGGWVSTEVEANADAPLRILQATTRRCMGAHHLEREISCKALLQTTNNWNSAQVLTVASGAQWNGGASSDPVKNIHNAIEASFGGVTAIGMSELAYHEFCRNPQVQKFIQFKDDKDPLPDPAKLSLYFKLPPFVVGKMKYITGADTVAPTYVWGNDVVLIRQPEEMPPSSQEDVATAYTFRWNVVAPKDGSATNGWIVRQFFTQNRGGLGGMKIVVVRYDAEKMTGKYVGGLIHNAIQCVEWRGFGRATSHPNEEDMPEEKTATSTVAKSEEKTKAAAAPKGEASEHEYKVIHGTVHAPHGDLLDKETGRHALVAYPHGSTVILPDDAATRRMVKDKLIERC